MIQKTRNDCIDCNLCKKNCDFLKKYDINLKDLTYRQDLKDSCFLCERCREVCPKNLSGADIVKQMRKKEPKSKTVKILKQHYAFKNYPHENCDTVLFLGCNFPGFYPKTCNYLIDIARDMGIDFVVDCCQKPVYESGYEVDFKKIEKNFTKRGIKKIIFLCPNCYHFLKDKIDIKCISVYRFLFENNLGEEIKERVNIFFPCSDRYSRDIFSYIEKYTKDIRKDEFEDVNCCGLGGGARKYEKDIISKTREKLEKKSVENIYTYCSSCSGAFENYGLKNIKSVLSEILSVHEDVSENYAKNLIYFKFKKHK